MMSLCGSISEPNVDVGCERDFLRQHLISGSSTSPLAVVDEPECIRQSIQVGQKIAVVEIRAAVEDDGGLPPPDFSRARLRTLWITVASRITRQPFRARPAS